MKQNLQETEPEDEDFARFQAGDPEAFEALLRPVDRQLLAYIRVFSGDRDTAEDVAQESMIRLWKNREKIHNRDSILPWLLVTAKRLCLQHRRSRKASQEYQIDPLVIEEVIQEEDRQTPGHNASENQRYGILLEAIQKLKPEEQELIVLKFFSKLKVEEIANTLSMPMGSVGVKTSRSLEKLRKALRQKGYVFEDLL